MEYFNHPVDRILEEALPYRLSALKFISGNNPIFFEHFPGDPVYPGSLILGAVLITLGLLTMKSGNLIYTDEELRLENIKFKNKCRPGDLLKIEVEAIYKGNANELLSNGVYQFNVERYYSGDGICKGRIIVDTARRQVV